MSKVQSKVSENLGEIHIDTDLTLYEGFFDHQWAEEMLTLGKKTPLDTQIVNLCVTWKGISHARRLPWLMMYMLQAQQEQHNDLSLAFPRQVIQLFIQKLGYIAQKRYVSLSKRSQKILCEELEHIQDEVIEEYQKNRTGLVKGHINQLWMELTQAPELGFGLWMSEVNAYISVYFAYETFLVQALKVAYPGETRLRVQHIEEFFKRTNNENMQQQYWDDKAIEKSRLIRHAVTHNGRKVTGDLGSKFKGELILTSTKEVVIQAHDTNQLYQLLKEKVTAFSKELLALPSMAT